MTDDMTTYQIHFPPELYRRLSGHALGTGKDVETVLDGAVSKYLEEKDDETAKLEVEISAHTVEKLQAAAETLDLPPRTIVDIALQERLRSMEEEDKI